MAGFKIRVLTAGPHVVTDLGIVLDSLGAAPLTEDHTSLPPNDVARSADLATLITGGDIVIVDARDDTDATFLSLADSLEAVENHNDTHFGISGGRFNDLDDPTVVIDDDYIVQYDLGTDSYLSVNPTDLLQDFADTIGQITAGMGRDGTDTTFSYDPACNYLIAGQDETNYDAAGNNGTFSGGAGYAALDTIVLDNASGSVVTVDAVAAGVVTDFTVTSRQDTNVTDGVALTQFSTSGGGAGFTLTPESNNTSEGCIEWSVDDVFLRNTGDTLDSGTLTIASGAAVAFGAGSTITIDAAVTTATIDTPGGGFTGATDIINKEYVDSVAAGLDWKESARVATTPSDGDITAGLFGGTYAAGGGPSGSGEFTGVDLSSGTGASIDGLFFTGSSATGLVVGDRVVIKNQGSATENGIYEITAGPAASATLTRAADHDGTPASEVSGGNTVYIEDTTAINPSSTNSNTIWSVIFDGTITLNTDPVDWTQVAGPGSFVARIGLSNDGVIIDLDVDDLTSATVATADSIAFHDADGAANSSGSQTRKTTVSDFLNDLDIVYGITSNGLIRRTGNDTYEQVAIVEDTTAGLEGANVVNGGVGDTGDIEIGLDIQNLAATAGVTGTDRVPVWDGTNNVYYTVTQLAGAAGASNSFETWAQAGNGSGGPIVAASPTDTATLTGGIGIDIDMVGGTDTVTWNFTDSGMANTAIAAADGIVFFDADNGGEAEFRTASSLITDLGLQTAAYTTIGGDSGTATASGADTLNLVGETSGGITTTASEPGTDQVAFGITPIDLATGAATLATGDFIIVSDALDTATTLAQKYTFADMIADLGLVTTTSITAYGTITGGDGGSAVAIGQDSITFNGTGINITATNAGAGLDTVAFVMDISDLADGNPSTIVAGDEIAVNDGGTTVRYSWADVIADLGLLTSGNTVNYTTYGGDSGTASPATNTDTINFVGGTNGGITTVASEPGTDQIAFNITPIDLTTGAATLTTADFIIVSDSADAVSTVALKYTFADMIADLSLLTSTTGVTDAFGVIAGGDGGTNATAIGTDTITVNGTGINVTTTNGGAGADTLDLLLDVSDLPAFTGSVVGADTIAVNNAGTTEQVALSTLITDLGILTSVSASVDEDELGIVVTGGDTIGLTIDTLTDPGDDLAATDEFVIHDKSEGTGGANRKITGTNVAEGVASILGIVDLTFSTINGQTILTYEDGTRTKTLSVDSNTYTFSDNTLDDGSWVEIGNAIDTDAGHIMPFDGTIVGVTAMTENANASTYELDLFINGALDSAGIATLTGTGIDTDVDMTLDRDFSQGDRIRIQVDRTAGSGIMQDTVVNLLVRWRA